MLNKASHFKRLAASGGNHGCWAWLTTALDGSGTPTEKIKEPVSEWPSAAETVYQTTV
jgi:hypothetical protein